MHLIQVSAQNRNFRSYQRFIYWKNIVNSQPKNHFPSAFFCEWNSPCPSLIALKVTASFLISSMKELLKSQQCSPAQAQNAGRMTECQGAAEGLQGIHSVITGSDACKLE